MAYGGNWHPSNLLSTKQTVVIQTETEPISGSFTLREPKRTQTNQRLTGYAGNLYQYWFTMSIVTFYFSQMAEIIVATILPCNALRSDSNSPHMATQPSLEAPITPCHSYRCPPGQRRPPYQGFLPDKNFQFNRKMIPLGGVEDIQYGHFIWIKIWYTHQHLFFIIHMIHMISNDIHLKT